MSHPPPESHGRWPRNVALVHDFFGVRGGAEQVAFELARIFPQADVYTSVLDVATLPEDLMGRRIRTSSVLGFVIKPRHYRYLLPALPFYFSRLDLRAYDLVVSSSIAFSKAVLTRREALHVCYCYTPNRYAWDLDSYLAGSGLPTAVTQAARAYRPWLKRWDLRVASRPDRYVAVSRATQARIQEVYGRTSSVVNPFVDAAPIRSSEANEGFLLCVGRLVGYKRTDIAIAAAEDLGMPLKVVGSGPAGAALRKQAGPWTELLGSVSNEAVRDLYSRCSMVLLPGVEDFSLVALEAMAFGKPVVAFDAGGVKDSVQHLSTGFLFSPQDRGGLSRAIQAAAATRWDQDVIRRRAMDFSRERFRTGFLAAVEEARREKFGFAV